MASRRGDSDQVVLAGGRITAAGGVWALFATTLLLAAFLLFWVEPMFTRMALPLLGGASAVWNTAMVFFQSALLAGYAYVHVNEPLVEPAAPDHGPSRPAGARLAQPADRDRQAGGRRPRARPCSGWSGC